MKKINVIGIIGCLLIIMSCSNSDKAKEIKITVPIKEAPTVRENLGDLNQSYQVLGEETLTESLAKKELIFPGSIDAKRWFHSAQNTEARGASFPLNAAIKKNNLRKKSLAVSFPKKLLGENFVFGGVITEVSDLQNELLGGLKLSDLPPIHVKPELNVSENEFNLVLKGCLNKCSELSNTETILTIPIVALNVEEEKVVLDLAAIGESLNLIKMLDPDGSYTQLKTISSRTVAVDFSDSTLVFDVKVSMIPLVIPIGEKGSTVDFTIRWYLRLGSVFNPSFLAREQTEGVGYFTTDRGLYPKIIRHALGGSTQSGSIKYFVKNVPAEYQGSFKAAFEEWNQKFIEVTGYPIFQVEFIDSTDPRSQLLVTGDIRYKILEWDLTNRAPYGGLGPSIANQFTGEILSSNVLIQGPHIIDLYRDWFHLSEKVENLKSKGWVRDSELLKRAFFLSIDEREGKGVKNKFALSVGGHVAFKIHSQLRPLEDPLFRKEDFDTLPIDTSFQKYMEGYFRDMVAHELGHNIGLRHNFAGNLSAAEGEPMQGKVSSSIMEYLGRKFRYLDEIGVYDLMAIKYGYAGILPENKHGFCTDEEVADFGSLHLSAECSRDDATNDPYGYFLSRLQRGVDLVIARGSAEAPVWKADEVAKVISSTITGLGLYAGTSVSTGAHWTQFFNHPERPDGVALVSDYVQTTMDQLLCPSDLKEVLAVKSSVVQLETKLNLLGFIKKVNEVLLPLKLTKPVGGDCGLGA